MREVDISEFRANSAALFERVRKTRKPIRITRHGKPVAEIVPPTTEEDRAKWIASMQGSAETLGDIISPASDEDE